MVDSCWLIVEALVLLLLNLYTERVSYRTGIWDGAFNHFLPVVRREMIFYDERRAKKIFEAEDRELQAWPAGDELSFDEWRRGDLARGESARDFGA